MSFFGGLLGNAEKPAGATDSNFFSNLLDKIKIRPLTEDETRKLTYLASTTGRIVAMFPVVDKIGIAIAGIAKMKIDIDALKNINENVLKPIEQLKKTLLFFIKMNEITKTIVETARQKLIEDLEKSKKGVIDDVKDLEQERGVLNKEKKIIEGVASDKTSPDMVELMNLTVNEDAEDIKHQEKDIKEETEKVAEDAEKKRKSLEELINMMEKLSINRETIEDIQKNLDKIVAILTDKSILTKLTIFARDKINDIDVIMKSIENKLHALSFNYTSFTLFMTSNLGKIDETLPSEFFNKLFETQEFKDFASSSNDMKQTPTDSSSSLGAEALKTTLEMGLTRGGRRSKRRKSRGKKRTKRRHSRKTK
jgi:hypothetical protein